MVNQGGELSLKNLLTAVRSRRGRGVDVRVEEEFGFVQETRRRGAQIDRQIEAAYQTDCAKEALGCITPEAIAQSVSDGTWEDMTPEQLLWQLKEQQAGFTGRDSALTQAEASAGQGSGPTQAEASAGQGSAQTREAERWEDLEARYYTQQVKEFGANQQVEEAVLQMLGDYRQPVDTWHIMAAGQFLNDRNAIFRNLFDKEQMKEDPDLQEVKSEILKRFGEAIKTPEDMAKAQIALAETAEHVMEGMINETDISSQTARDLKLLRTQIQLGGAMGREENYAVPVLIADEMTNVQLKIVRGKKSRGMVDILFETERLGKVAARFTVSQERTEGFLVSDREETLRQLKDQEEQLRERLTNGSKALRIDYMKQEDLDLAGFTRGRKSTQDQGQSQEERQVQTRNLYDMAKQFIETVKQAV